MNGEDSEAKKIVASIKEQASSEAGYEEEARAESPASKGKNTSNDPFSTAADEESDITQYSSDSSEDKPEMQEIKEKAATSMEVADAPRRRSTRPKRGGKKAG